jgi:hypothetical protein
VKPATLVGATQVVPIANSTCGSASGDAPVPICSGETATVKVKVRAANTAVIPNRQVRFDVVFGAYQFVTDANGANPTSSVTLVTDQNGAANALIKAADGINSQAAVIRVTDLVSGNRVDTAFTIVQKINGTAVLSVVPGGGYKGKGFYKGECGGTSGDFLIYGGRPPYTVRSSLPNSIRLSVNGVTGSPVIVAAAGGRFTASSVFFTQCSGYKGEIVITDSSGLNFSVTYEEEAGTEELPAPPPPNALVVSPSTVNTTCPLGRAVNFSVIGGTAPYTLRTNRPTDTEVTGNTVTVTTAGGLAPGVTINVEVTDSASATATATIVCGTPLAALSLDPPAPAPALAAGHCNPPVGGWLLAVGGGLGPAPVPPLSASASPAAKVNSAISGSDVVVTTDTPTSLVSGDLVTVTVSDGAGRSGTRTFSCP